jgi:MarR family transcriptional regulator, 2-MHQ and catechol-resistance regulon repressor
MKASKAVVENIRTDIESHIISNENFIILELLYSKGPHPVQKISEILSIPSGSITYVVDKLEKKGLVERQPNPNAPFLFLCILIINFFKKKILLK